MFASSQNMTSYGGSPGYLTNNFPNDYNQTNALLHTKYHNMNQTEVPQMKFSNRQGNLNLKLIQNLDLNYIIKSNNIIPLEKISNHLIFSKIKDEDYEDQNTPKLLKTFQYVLEYLNEKQTKLVNTNEKLNVEYNQLINQSYEIEEKLKINKNIITKNSVEKKEKEMILITYESIVNFNCNPTDNINVITKTINKNYNRTSEKSMGGTYQEGKFYCHICNGKFFNTESKLESHMKRRHLAQIKKNARKERERKRDEEILEEYDKKLEETKNYLQTKIEQKNEMFSKEKFEDELNMMKKENEQKMNLLIDYTKNFPEQMKNIFQTYMNQQEEQNNKNLMFLANTVSNSERGKNETQKIIIENPSSNNINALTNSIENLAEIIKQQKDKENDFTQNQNKILKDKLHILENQSKILNDGQNRESPYQYEYMDNKKNIIINNDTKNINNNQNNVNLTNLPTTYLNPNQFEQNNNINSTQKESINNQIVLNSISNKEDTIKNEISFQRKKMVESDDENQSKNDNNNIQSNNFKTNNNNYYSNQNQNNYQLSNSAENFNNKNNLVNIYKEVSPKKDNNNFNNTAPNSLKIRKFRPIQPKNNLLVSSTIKELDRFYANFMNREQPIIGENKPETKAYLEEIIPENKRKDEKQKNEKYVEDKIKKQYFMNLDDFDKKGKNELFDIIGKTMENINEINSDNKFKQLYYETAQKAIDLKLLEEDVKMMKTAYDKKGELKRSRSSSRAKFVIQQAENEKYD